MAFGPRKRRTRRPLADDSIRQPEGEASSGDCPNLNDRAKPFVPLRRFLAEDGSGLAEEHRPARSLAEDEVCDGLGRGDERERSWGRRV